MLVLSRGPSDKIVFPHLQITLEVLRIHGNRVRVGVKAPPDVVVLRHEVAEKRDCLPAEEPPSASSLTHSQRSRLHVAQLALQLLDRQLENGMSPEAGQTLQRALREFDAVEAEFSKPQESENAELRRRALVVEDNANESELLSGYLRMSGYDVDIASDGLKALVYLARHQVPDVVLLDMQMPGLDGPGTVRSIRSNQALEAIKIFAVTGKGPEETGVNIGPGGVDRWFRKPVNPRELVAEMHRTLAAACTTSS